MFKVKGTTRLLLHWGFCVVCMGEAGRWRVHMGQTWGQGGQAERSEETWVGQVKRGLSFRPGRLPPAGPSPQKHTCRSYSSEVVGPAQHHAGPVAGALDQRPGQGGEQEDHSQVQHRHEEGEVEALYGAQSTAAGRSLDAALTSAPHLVAGALSQCSLRALWGLSPALQSLGIRDLVPPRRSHRQQADKWAQL